MHHVPASQRGLSSAADNTTPEARQVMKQRGFFWLLVLEVQGLGDASGGGVLVRPRGVREGSSCVCLRPGLSTSL